MLNHKTVGLKPMADGSWAAYFGSVELRWLDEADYRIKDVKERARRYR